MPARDFTGLGYVDFVAGLCAKRRVGTYLEIGVFQGALFSSVSCSVAIGVDPRFRLAFDIMRGKKAAFLFQETSDAFFAGRHPAGILGAPLDFAFIDGMHLFEWALRDFVNTEAICGRDAVIALHDAMPLDGVMIDRDPRKVAQEGPRSGYWTGDVWKMVPILARHRPDLRLTFVDCPPTGVVCVSGLDPTSSRLSERYADIVREAAAIPNTEASLATAYAGRRIASSRALLEA